MVDYSILRRCKNLITEGCSDSPSMNGPRHRLCAYLHSYDIWEASQNAQALLYGPRYRGLVHQSTGLPVVVR